MWRKLLSVLQRVYYVQEKLHITRGRLIRSSIEIWYIVSPFFLLLLCPFLSVSSLNDEKKKKQNKVQYCLLIDSVFNLIRSTKLNTRRQRERIECHRYQRKHPTITIPLLPGLFKSDNFDNLRKSLRALPYSRMLGARVVGDREVALCAAFLKRPPTSLLIIYHGKKSNDNCNPIEVIRQYCTQGCRISPSEKSIEDTPATTPIQLRAAALQIR